MCNYSKGTTLQHHSSENKNVPDHRTVTEYIILTNHVAWMYSHLPFLSPNVQCTKGGCHRKRKACKQRTANYSSHEFIKMQSKHYRFVTSRDNWWVPKYLKKKHFSQKKNNAPKHKVCSNKQCVKIGVICAEHFEKPEQSRKLALS